MGFQLVVTGGPDQGTIIEIPEGESKVIGRGEASTDRLSDPSVSRVHFAVSIKDGVVFLTDQGSSSGTFVNGSKVETIELKPGHEIRVGDSTLRVDSDHASNATTYMAGAGGAPAAPAKPLNELVGQQIAEYQLDEIIGPGNSGMVFKATDHEKNRTAAVKVLSPTFTSTDEERQRFIRAMKTILPINSDRIVKLYNAGKNGPYCWAAMEYIDGENLAELIDRTGIDGMLDWKKVWRVAVDIAVALKAGYEHQIIHRNVTPKNILRRNSDEACLLGDFMLAKALQGSLALQLLGEIPYMAPERTRPDANVDTRSDMYGLGATCYALLTGRPPATGDSMPAIVQAVRETAPENPRAFQMSVDENFADVVMRMIEKDPANRYQNPDELLTALLRIGKFNNLDAGI